MLYDDPDNAGALLQGFLWTRPIMVELHDTGSVYEAVRRAKWLLWRQTLLRAFLQPPLIESIKAGLNGTAAVPELAELEIDLHPVIDPMKPEYQKIRSGFILNWKTSEAGT